MCWRLDRQWTYSDILLSKLDDDSNLTSSSVKLSHKFYSSTPRFQSVQTTVSIITISLCVTAQSCATASDWAIRADCKCNDGGRFDLSLKTFLESSTQHNGEEAHRSQVLTGFTSPFLWVPRHQHHQIPAAKDDSWLLRQLVISSSGYYWNG